MSHVRLSVTPWTAAPQASLSFTISQSLLKLMSIESVMPSDHPSFVTPFSSCLQSFPASGSFSNKSALQVRWPKYWSCSISPSNEYSGLLTKTLYFDETLISLLRALDWTRDDLGLPSPSLQNPVWVRVLWSQFSENSPKVSGYPRYHADIRLACLKQGFFWVSLARSPLPMITPLSHFHPLIHILPLRYGSPLSLLESEFSLVSLPYHKPHLSSLTVSVCMCIHAKSLQSCLTLCNPIDCSPPGFSVHGILPTRILEWVAILSSRGSSRTREQTCVSCVSCFGRRFLYH